MTYKKPYKTTAEQLAIIKSRNLLVSDDARAIRWLEKSGYYRLSGYWHVFRDFSFAPDVIFKDGANFDDVINIYLFDKKLRLFILDALERIEVALRVDIALYMGQTCPYAYLDAKMLDGNFSQKINIYTGKTKHEEWIEKLDSSFRSSTEEFITEFKNSHPTSKLPIWIAIELWDFGMLSKFYEGMKYYDKKAISQKYNIYDPVIFISWLKSLNYVRNICAHHGRLWNKAIVISPRFPSKGTVPEFDHVQPSYRIYDVIVILRYLLQVLNPTQSWANKFKLFISTFPKSKLIQLNEAGFPDNWLNQNLWM